MCLQYISYAGYMEIGHTHGWDSQIEGLQTVSCQTSLGGYILPGAFLRTRRVALALPVTCSCIFANVTTYEPSFSFHWASD